jgi:ArsR family transcriptional regulator, lead/cadmium/zinc/bismuth-responsive transcriptional repressor
MSSGEVEAARHGTATVETSEQLFIYCGIHIPIHARDPPVPETLADEPTETPIEDALCDVHVVDEDAVRDVLSGRATDREIDQLAETFQLLASPTRLRIMEALSGRELCVCDLAALTGVSQSAVSHHLRMMRALRLVRYRKESRMAYYRLDDDHIGVLFDTGLEHVRE